ncbi:MAG: metallophosphoesterase [Clostridia bacterium]|nr:metallophosphoesterase [Clostridia bacterium]
MSLYAISDLHLSIGEPEKTMEVFRGWQDYTYRLKKNWNAVVEEEDTVVIAGDLSWAMKLDKTFDDLNFLNNELNGNKIILKGNHDLWWDTVTKMNKYFEEQNFDKIKILHNNFYSYNDTAICGTRGWFFEDGAGDKKILNREAGRLDTSIKMAKNEGFTEIAVFLHYPPLYGDQQCDEIMEVLNRHEIESIYYGHIHGSGAHNAFRGEKDGAKFTLISSDFNDFTPIFIKK